MEDIKLWNSCNHLVETIIDVNGISPNFYAILPFTSNKNIVNTSIYEFSEVDGLTFFDASVDGITNFSYNGDGTRIEFGTYPIDYGMNFPDPNINYVPKKVYIAEYGALKDSCPKCNGTNIVKDIAYNTVGRLITLQGRYKVVQQILKILLTIVGGNLFDQDYGTTLSASIGQKLDNYVVAKLNQSILAAMNHLMNIQQINGVPDNERIIRVADINATRDTNDARGIHLEVIVTLASYENVTTKLRIQL